MCMCRFSLVSSHSQKNTLYRLIGDSKVPVGEHVSVCVHVSRLLSDCRPVQVIPHLCPTVAGTGSSNPKRDSVGSEV